MRKMRNKYILDGNYEGKEALGRTRHRWEIIVKDKETRCEDVTSLHLVHDMVSCRVLVNVVINLGFHKDSGNNLGS